MEMANHFLDSVWQNKNENVGLVLLRQNIRRRDAKMVDLKQIYWLLVDSAVQATWSIEAVTISQTEVEVAKKCS